MKKKWIWINFFVAIIVFVSIGLAAAFGLSYPIKLTEQEIDYYTDVAENVWYNGMNSVEYDDDIIIKYHLLDKTVSIYPSQKPNKQSITVDFSNSEKSVTVNKPSTSMVGCFFFYGAVAVLVALAVSVNVISGIQDNRVKKKG